MVAAHGHAPLPSRVDVFVLRGGLKLPEGS